MFLLSVLKLFDIVLSKKKNDHENRSSSSNVNMQSVFVAHQPPTVVMHTDLSDWMEINTKKAVINGANIN